MSCRQDFEGTCCATTLTFRLMCDLGSSDFDFAVLRECLCLDSIENSPWAPWKSYIEVLSLQLWSTALVKWHGGCGGQKSSSFQQVVDALPESTSADWIPLLGYVPQITHRWSNKQLSACSGPDHQLHQALESALLLPSWAHPVFLYFALLLVFITQSNWCFGPGSCMKLSFLIYEFSNF